MSLTFLPVIFLDEEDNPDGFATVGPYRLVADLGAGTFGRVVKGERLPDLSPVAIKIWNKRKLRRQRWSPQQPRRHDEDEKDQTELGDRAVFLTGEDRVRLEMSLLVGLPHHDNVLQALEPLESDESLLLVMSLAMGPIMTLKSSPLSSPLAGKYVFHPCLHADPQAEVLLSLFKDLVHGVSFLHSCGVCHRDIKPDNLLFVNECSRAGGVVLKIGDFGCAVRCCRGDLFTETVGTPAFLCPESFASQSGEYSPYAADCWQVGVTLYAIFAEGSLPFNIARALGYTGERGDSDEDYGELVDLEEEDKGGGGGEATLFLALERALTNNALDLPEGYLPPLVGEALHGLLAKDPRLRWSIGDALLRIA